jgi:hypothetical protein
VSNRAPVWNWLLLAFLTAVIASQAAAQATSTAEERAQWAGITHKLEISPLDPDVSKEGEKSLQRVIEVHDFHVPLCPAFFADFNAMKYTYAHAITRQFMLASAAFLIENPGRADDRNAMNLAAMESVLKAYAAILQQKPDAKAKVLDDLLQKQKQGKLAEYIQKRCP